MNNKKNFLDGSLEEFNEKTVPKIRVFAGEDMTSEVYFFKPHQVLKAHRHPDGEQIFFFFKGSGKMSLGDNVTDVTVGNSVFVKAGEWHEITNGDSEMIAVQVTKVGAGAEYKEN
jgi:quercetin dioxygenase-like cupin family protein